MSEDNGRRFLFLTHIYAGARVKHEDTGEIENLWQERYSERYFELLERYGDKLILEVAGHDHWEDLRLYAPYVAPPPARVIRRTPPPEEPEPTANDDGGAAGGDAIPEGAPYRPMLVATGIGINKG